MTSLRLAAVLAFVALDAPDAAAMTCVRATDADILRTAQVAFVGVAQSQRDVSEPPNAICQARSRKHPECGRKVTTFRVTEWLRGTPAPEVAVLSDDSCYCLGPAFKPGTTYVVIAQAPKPGEGADPVAASECQGTGRLDERAQRLLGAFRGAPERRGGPFPLSLETVRELRASGMRALSFEQRGGDILVTLTDRHGDAHVHRLEHAGTSKEQALELLARKQAELAASPR